MTTHPYKSLPDKAFWRRSVAMPAPGDVDPVGVFGLRIGQDSKVATAGSCFAQHIARHLRSAGFQYFVAEQGHPLLAQEIREKHHYGLFSARYGNIYTARQLLQLFQRAYGRFEPLEQAWVEPDGTVVDPFRPTIQPGGFVCVEEMLADRQQHLAAVRHMFETLDVFVFTLGLTECWASTADGAVFPLCPGVEGGVFDAAKYRFENHDVTQIVADLDAFVEALRQVNPRAEIMFTVSPVPLMATADEGAHVLSATTYSKSVLRVAAETMRRKYPFVHYFPSFEIITGAYSRGRYFADDLRNVTEEGVSHVMRLFLAHATGGVRAPAAVPRDASAQAVFEDRVAELVEVECDEVALDRK